MGEHLDPKGRQRRNFLSTGAALLVTGLFSRLANASTRGIEKGQTTLHSFFHSPGFLQRATEEVKEITMRMSTSATIHEMANDRSDNNTGLRTEDSTGTISWKKYFDAVHMLDAWTPPPGSLYAPFVRTRTLLSVTSPKVHELHPRHSIAEQHTADMMQVLHTQGYLNKETAIILDSGGAHSVAMAAKLVREYGYQPVLMLDVIPHSSGVVASGEDIAVMLYHAEEMHKLKEDGRIKPNAPPVFILDAHRGETPLDDTQVNNSHPLGPNDFPGPEVFHATGIKRLVYLNESDKDAHVKETNQGNPEYIEDIRASMKQNEDAGIQLFTTGVSPWEGDEAFTSLDWSE